MGDVSRREVLAVVPHPGLGRHPSGSTRYRILNPAAALRDRLRVSLVFATDRDLGRDPTGGDGVVAVIQRAGDPEVVERLQARGIRLFADFDDLLVGDPAGVPRVRAGRMDLAEAAFRTERYRAALSLVDRITVSTGPLAEELAKQDPRLSITVVPNGIDAWWMNQGRRLYRRWRPGDPRVIRYLPGTSSHDRDFAMIQPMLVEALGRWPDLSLEIVGPIRADLTMFPRGRVLRRKPVTFDHLAGFYASSWVTLAPLEDAVFNRCKSAIKFLESAAMGCPCIATPIPDMLRFTPDGPLLADDPGQWLGHIERLREDDHRESVSKAGVAMVLRKGLAAEAAEILLATIEGWFPG